MAEWQTSEPPVDREIEFEKDGRELMTGILSHGGSSGFGVPGKMKMKPLFLIKDTGLALFEVTRWRELD